MAPVIRWVNPSEALEVLALAETCHGASRVERAPAASPLVFPTLVAEDAARLVGYASFTMAPDPKRGFVCYGVDLGVHPAYRKCGLGRELHEERCRVAKEAGAVDFIGTIPHDNAAMKRLLASAGCRLLSSALDHDFYLGRL